MVKTIYNIGKIYPFKCLVIKDNVTFSICIGQGVMALK